MATSQHLKQYLQHKQHLAHQQLQQKYPDAHQLLTKKNLLPGNLRRYATKFITTATIATTMLTHTGLFSLIPTQLAHTPLKQFLTHRQAIHASTPQQLHQLLDSIITSDTGELNHDQISALNYHFQSNFGIRTAAELDGYKLNHQYGWIGFEQHLLRYPGDTISQHDAMHEAGMAPATGAWGYFAHSKQDLTPQDIEREKYYVAVQTLYIPEWNISQPAIKDWYKYRKVVVINPQNGQAIVANIADAGPAKWTGKQFGGSPEVMKYLNLHQGPRKGKVVLLFVDDPHDTIPLGPLEYKPPSSITV